MEVGGELAQAVDQDLRRARVGGGGHRLRERQQLRHQVLLGLVGQAVARGVAAGAVVGELLLGQLAEQAGHARVGVLHVVHRVVIGVLAREFEVEVQVLLVAAHHVEEARGVVADVLAQLAQGHELAGAGRHLHPLAALVQHRELHQQDLDPAGVEAQRLRHALEPRHVAVVVGAEHVDDAVVAALELVGEVGDVGSEVGGDAVLAHHHAVLLVAEGAGAEPGGAIALVQVPGGAQLVQRLAHRARGAERALAEPVVVVHAELAQVLADVGQAGLEAGIEHDAVVGLAEQLLGARDQRVDVGLLVAALRLVRRQALGDLVAGVAQAVALAPAQFAADLDHVVALVAVVGEAHRHAAEVEVAQPHAHRQDVHLAAVVVDVVLAIDRVAVGLEQVAQGRAIGRAAAVAHVQRTVRIGRDELKHHRLARAGIGAAVALATLEHAADRAHQAGRADVEVDEARARDLGLLDQARLRQRGGERLRQLARIAAQLLGQQHRHVAGVVAVLLAAGALDHEGGLVAGRQRAVAAQVEHGLQHQFAE